MKPTDINELCDGGAKINVKGTTTLCAKNTYVYVFSNWRIDEVYKHAMLQDPEITMGLKARFKEYTIDENYNLK